jgi:DUF917 family protein
MVKIRPIRSEADFPGIAAVINAFELVPVTTDRVREQIQLGVTHLPSSP